MHPVAVVRNLLIFAGLAGGGYFAVSAALAAKPETAQTQQASSLPIVLNTAKPPDLGKTPLARPISLESGFGRTELTGEEVLHVPDSPLDELIIDRRWDISLALTPPKPPTDLPPEKASDEVGEPQPEDVAVKDDIRLTNMPNEARRHADEAAADYKEGTRLLKEGLKESRLPGVDGKAGREKMAAAADYLRDARDKLSKALDLAPNHPDLVDLMQKIKANLFVCNKHGR